MDLDHIFKYHAPNDEQQKKYEILRAAAKAFAQAIVDCVPVGADQTAAVRKMREAVMTANAGVALNGKL